MSMNKNDRHNDNIKIHTVLNLVQTESHKFCYKLCYSPQGASCKSSTNKNKRGWFAMKPVVSLQFFWHLMLFSIVCKSLELRSGLAGRLMCGLSKVSTVWHSVVFPEPGSPETKTGCFASSMRFRRYVYFLYYEKHLRHLLIFRSSDKYCMYSKYSRCNVKYKPLE